MTKKNAVIPVGAYDARDTQPTLRAAALILDWATDAGNESVDGFIAVGIAHTLRLVADRMDLDEQHRTWVANKTRELAATRK